MEMQKGDLTRHMEMQKKMFDQVGTKFDKISGKSIGFHENRSGLISLVL
jgi:hypothetical protein